MGGTQLVPYRMRRLWEEVVGEARVLHVGILHSNSSLTAWHASPWDDTVGKGCCVPASCIPAHPGPPHAPFWEGIVGEARSVAC